MLGRSDPKGLKIEHMIEHHLAITCTKYLVILLAFDPLLVNIISLFKRSEPVRDNSKYAPVNRLGI